MLDRPIKGPESTTAEARATALGSGSRAGDRPGVAWLPGLSAALGWLALATGAGAFPNPYPAPYPTPYPAPYPAPYPQPSPQPMPGQSLLFPRPGVICDAPAQRCYDSQGLSLQQTGMVFGNGAQQQAWRELGGRPPSPIFSFSNGSSCDGRRAICWDSFGGQRRRNQQLTSQLFGSLPPPSPGPSPQPGPSPNPAGYSGQCRLSRYGQPLYQGLCALNETRQGFQSRFDVLLQNGASYRVQPFGQGYLISDGQGGTWPVQVSGYGNTALLNWADMSLAVTQNAYRPELTPNQRWGRAIGNLLINLFN